MAYNLLYTYTTNINPYSISGITIRKEDNKMCCGTAKNPCIELELHPIVAENCCGTAKSPCIEIEAHPEVAENCCGTAKSPCIEIEAHPEVKENSSESSE
jgi:hypothetical protein